MKAHVHINIHVSIIHNHQEMDNPSDQLMNRHNTKHTMEYDLLIKENEVLLCATTWMNFKNMISKKSQKKKATFYIIPLI